MRVPTPPLQPAVMETTAGSVAGVVVRLVWRRSRVSGGLEKKFLSKAP